MSLTILGMGRRRMRRASAATAMALLVAGAVGGCRRTGRDALEPLPEVPLLGLEAAASREIAARIAKCEKSRLDRAVPDAEVAAACGAAGRILHAYQRLDAAAVAYGDAALVAPRDPRWPYLLGLVYADRGRTKEAVSSLERAAALAAETPEAPLVDLALARAHAREGRFAASRAAAERALGKRPDLAAAWVAAAEAAAALGDHFGAVRGYQAALRLQPFATKLHGPLAVELQRAGRGGEAREHERRRGEGTILIDDPWLSAVAAERRDAAALNDLASRAFELGDFAVAADAFAEVASRRPADPLAHVNLGSALHRLGREAEAEREYREALRLDPRSLLAHFNLGVVLAATGREEEAVAEYRAALAVDATARDARLNLANGLRRLGRFAEALAEYERVAAEEPGRVGAWVGQAVCLARLDRAAEALARVRRGLVAAPGDRGLLRAAARLTACGPLRDAKRDGEVLALAQQLASMGATADALETVAMAAAASGDFTTARVRQETAIRALPPNATPRQRERLARQLDRYRRSERCADPGLD